MFALMNYFVNAAGELPLMQKVFFRNAIATVVAFFVLLSAKEKFRIHDRSCVVWLFLRAGVGFIGVVLNFYAIDALPSISDASILNKLSPFFAVLFSVFLLKEKPKIPEIIFLLIAFAGAMCVVNPRFDLQVLPALAGFFSGACAGFAYTCVRILGIKGEAPAKEIAVFDYAQVLFAALLGYFLLDQIPQELSLIGYAVIILAAFGRWLYHILGEKPRRVDGQSEQIQSKNEQKPPDTR